MKRLRMTQKALALRAGLNETAVRDIRTGKSRHPRHDTVQKLAGVLGLAVNELLEPNWSRADQASAPRGEFALVPEYDVAAAAGHGSFVEQATKLGRLAFQAEWLRSVTSAPVDQLAVITVRGDSMFPTLVDGDTVLVDCSAHTIRHDGIYLVRAGDGLLIKRLQIDPARGRVIISCDNKDYPPLAPVSADEVAVEGRVIWVGRRICGFDPAPVTREVSCHHKRRTVRSLPDRRIRSPCAARRRSPPA